MLDVIEDSKELELVTIFEVEVFSEIMLLSACEESKELTELSKEGKVVPQLTTSNVIKGAIIIFFIQIPLNLINYNIKNNSPKFQKSKL
jgi:hypothetical protein